MSARRISWWVYVIAIALGLLLGALAASSELHRNITLTGTSWIASIVMIIVGIAELVLAWQVHRYTTTEPKKRVELKTITPQHAVRVLVFAKALAVAGALLVGIYGGQILVLWSRVDTTYYREVIIQCAIAVGASLFDMIMGIISEGLCKIPPTEGPEHPKIKQMKTNTTMA